MIHSIKIVFYGDARFHIVPNKLVDINRVTHFQFFVYTGHVMTLVLKMIC